MDGLSERQENELRVIQSIFCNSNNNYVYASDEKSLRKAAEDAAKRTATNTNTNTNNNNNDDETAQKSAPKAAREKSREKSANRNPCKHFIQLTLFPQSSHSHFNHDIYVQIDLKVAITPNYPNEYVALVFCLSIKSLEKSNAIRFYCCCCCCCRLPRITLVNEKGMSLDQVKHLHGKLVQKASEMLGNEMIYELCLLIQEYLYENNKAPAKSFYEQRLEQNIDWERRQEELDGEQQLEESLQQSTDRKDLVRLRKTFICFFFVIKQFNNKKTCCVAESSNRPGRRQQDQVAERGATSREGEAEARAIVVHWPNEPGDAIGWHVFIVLVCLGGDERSTTATTRQERSLDRRQVRNGFNFCVLCFF